MIDEEVVQNFQFSFCNASQLVNGLVEVGSVTIFKAFDFHKINLCLGLILIDVSFFVSFQG